ncbi:MAG: DUF861 domain-containing protein [Proteobacteria bacterium]|nr:DUF861 domain-containing protein [Pseudomonadota bacterium]
MTAPLITRLDANVTLDRWDDMPAGDLESGSPVQHGYYYVDDKENGLTAGVWDCTAHTGVMAPYPVNEFMILLEGELTMIEEGGRETLVRAGESFIIPKGLVCQWKQPGYIKKFFVIFDDKSGMDPTGVANFQILKPDPQGALSPAAPPPADILLGPVPEWSDNISFTDATGQWTAGVWHSTAFHRKPGNITRHELMHILEGAVTMPDGQGGTQRFAAGDTFMAPLGAFYEWDSDEPVRKLFCSLTPNTA